MEWLKTIVYNLLHLNQTLGAVIAQYGAATYLILVAIIFCETGLVVTPFLPGDSLLFAAGAFARSGHLNLVHLCVLLSIAAIVGDTVNYSIGHFIGPRAFTGHYRFLKKEHLDRTHRFFERYGGMTIILARFVPIVRTFAPFVAGIGSMSYSRFIIYNVIGGVAWVVLLTLSGYIFAQIPWVNDHFEVVVVAIVFISVLPMVIEYLRARWSCGGDKQPVELPAE